MIEWQWLIVAAVLGLGMGIAVGVAVVTHWVERQGCRDEPRKTQYIEP